jgi:hypothetical protein
LFFCDLLKTAFGTTQLSPEPCKAGRFIWALFDTK